MARHSASYCNSSLSGDQGAPTKLEHLTICISINCSNKSVRPFPLVSSKHFTYASDNFASDTNPHFTVQDTSASIAHACSLCALCITYSSASAPLYPTDGKINIVIQHLKPSNHSINHLRLDHINDGPVNWFAAYRPAYIMSRNLQFNPSSDTHLDQ